jgi:hypothetical protein
MTPVYDPHAENLLWTSLRSGAYLFIFQTAFWSNGVVEYWSDGSHIKAKSLKTIPVPFPALQYSNTPTICFPATTTVVSTEQN